MHQASHKYEEFRHERKFLIESYTAKDVEQMIKFNPACFTEIYHPRRINNIYFDSLSFDSYFGNVEGDTQRVKARIRWYGDLFGEVKNAVLELKIKNGLLGTKEHYPLGAFRLDKDFSKQEIVRALESGQVPLNVRDAMLAMHPALLNSYSRKYYLSADKQLRLTIDKDLEFYRISYGSNTFLNKVQTAQVVVELKYDVFQEAVAEKVSNGFPFRMTKNSKYLQGVERVLF